jgi:hypothetical protein
MPCCQRFSLWVKEKSRSTPVQWIASIGTGASCAAGIHACFNLITSAMTPHVSGMDEDNVQLGLLITNYTLAAITFIGGAVYLRNEIFNDVASHKVEIDKHHEFIEDISEFLVELTKQSSPEIQEKSIRLRNKIVRDLEPDSLEMALPSDHVAIDIPDDEKRNYVRLN